MRIQQNYRYFITAILTLLLIPFALAEENKQIISLNEAINIALENNPDLMASFHSIAISRSKLSKSKSPLYPQVKFKFILPFIERESGVFADQLIWDFGKTPNLIKFQKSNLRASKYDHYASISNIVLQTKIEYYTAVIEKHYLIYANKKTEEIQKRLELIENLSKAGRASKLEVTEVKVNLGNVNLELLTIKGNYEASLINLGTIMGLRNEENFDVADMPVFKPVIIDLDAAINRALSKRPELKSLRSKEVGMNANVKASKRDFFPTIVGRVAYRFEGDGATGPDFIGGVGLRMPIFDGFSRFSEFKESKAKLSRTQAEISSLEQRTAADIKKLHMRLSIDQERIFVSEATKDSAEENLKLIKERVNLGLSSKIDLLEAESLLESTVANYVKSIADYNITVANLEKAIGERLE